MNSLTTYLISPWRFTLRLHGSDVWDRHNSRIGNSISRVIAIICFHFSLPLLTLAGLSSLMTSESIFSYTTPTSMLLSHTGLVNRQKFTWILRVNTSCLIRAHRPHSSYLSRNTVLKRHI